VSPRTVRALVRGWFAALGLMLLVFAGVTAQGAWDAVADRGAGPVGERPAGAPASPHPVAAPLPSVAAPAPGVTGTIALPPLPVGAAAMPLPALPAAAAPFAVGGRVADRARAMECLTAAIYYEAATEPDAGQQAVAQVVLNRVRHPAFPATVCGVVYQGSERAGCQFSFACDGATARVPSRGGWARAARVAAAALAGRVYAPVGLATHYHTYAVTPAWNRALVMTDAEGAHFFHRWKGWWGTAAAFSQRYAGGEPLPGPHLPAVVPVQVEAIAALPTPSLPIPVTPVASVRPTGAATGQPIAPAPAPAPVDARLAGSGEMLEQWRGTGQPIR